VPADIRVLKAGGRAAETFSRDKISDCLARVCKSRPISPTRFQEIARGIELKLTDHGWATVESGKIAALLADALRGIDRLAFERFVANYRDEAGELIFGRAQVGPEVDSPTQISLFEPEA